MTINERMFKTMSEKGIKSIDIANHLNITKSVLSNWKNRGTNPPAEYIVPICELLGISIEYLLTGTEKNNLTENEKELLESFKFLPDREQIKLIGIVEDKAKKFKETSEKSSDWKTG